MRRNYQLTVGIMIMSLVTSTFAQANICSKDATDPNFIKVTKLSSDSVRFDLCFVANYNQCTPLGSKSSYRLDDLSAIASSERAKMYKVGAIDAGIVLGGVVVGAAAGLGTAFYAALSSWTSVSLTPVAVGAGTGGVVAAYARKLNPFAHKKNADILNTAVHTDGLKCTAFRGSTQKIARELTQVLDNSPELAVTQSSKKPVLADNNQNESSSHSAHGLVRSAR